MVAAVARVFDPGSNLIWSLRWKSEQGTKEFLLKLSQSWFSIPITVQGKEAFEQLRLG